MLIQLARRLRPVVAALAVVMLSASGFAQANAIDAQIETITQVGKRGQGNEAATEAIRSLSQQGSEALVPILSAIDADNPLAENWLRGAFESISARTIESEDETWPTEKLESFITETENSPQARRLAYDWLAKVDPSVKTRLIPEMLLDPNPAFRRDAVDYHMTQAKAAMKEGNDKEAKQLYDRALTGAVDTDQVKDLKGALSKLGQEIELQSFFGFLPKWQIIGPFNNKDLIGFEAVYPPEENQIPQGTYAGQEGDVTWQPIETKDDYGLINIADQIGNPKGSVMYAVTEYESPIAGAAQVRLGTPNAWKLWVNGELVFAREEYHRGTEMDQYQVPVTLKKGENTILLKVLQNEQTQPWAQRYQFQLRITDAAGRALK